MRFCANCKKETQHLISMDPVGDLCSTCLDDYMSGRQAMFEARRLRPIELAQREEEKLKSERVDIDINAILLTTETNPNLNIVSRIEIISAECVLGINVFKDILTEITDVLGGRSKTFQKALRDARKTILHELKREAYQVGANAVVAVDLDYSEISGGGKTMLFAVASGTAVIIEKPDHCYSLNKPNITGDSR